MSWLDDAACKGATAIFFAEGQGHNLRAARAICAECPVIAECRQAGLHERHGIWGGLSPRQRRRLRRGLSDGRSHAPRVRAEAERLLTEGWTDANVARRTGVPQRTVLDWRRALGIRRGAGGVAA